MLRFAARLNGEPGKIRVEDIAELREAGFGDEQLLDIVATVAWMAFNNRWMLGLGVELP